MIRKRATGLRYGVHRRKKRRPPKVTALPPAAAESAVLQQLADSVRISRLAELMAEAELLRNHIVPCRPVIDIGTDVITHYGGVLKRVQVKGQATDGKNEHTFTFSTCRNEPDGKRPYKHNEIDAFIFVHTESARFFIVPAAGIIASGRCTITFSPTSHPQWENAWRVLKTA